MQCITGSGAHVVVKWILRIQPRRNLGSEGSSSTSKTTSPLVRRRMPMAWPVTEMVELQNPKIMLMVQKSSAHQLTLVVYPIKYKVLAPSQVVVWDFWTINGSNGKWAQIEDVFPMENEDIPASYLSLPEGIPNET